MTHYTVFSFKEIEEILDWITDFWYGKVRAVKFKITFSNFRYFSFLYNKLERSKLEKLNSFRRYFPCQMVKRQNSIRHVVLNDPWRIHFYMIRWKYVSGPNLSIAWFSQPQPIQSKSLSNQGVSFLSFYFQESFNTHSIFWFYIFEFHGGFWIDSFLDLFIKSLGL